MKKLVGLFLVLGLTSCSGSDVAVSYASRAHPECTNFQVLAHSYGAQSLSLTEINMQCKESKRSISVKCRFGFGIISDTVCYENN